MLPTIVTRRIADAEAVAAGLRDTAACCTDEQHALRSRLIDGSQTIDDLLELLSLVTFSAKLNQETIREMSR